MIETVVLPTLIALAFIAVLAVWRSAGLRRRRLALGGVLVLLDVWLWMIATAGPLGPHLVLAVILIGIHALIAFQLVTDLTGFSVKNSRTTRAAGGGRYRPSGRGSGYSGYHAD